MTSLYRTIITKAWEIIKHYKFLWLFGFFVAFLGNASEYRSLFTQLDRIKNNSETFLDLGYKINLWGTILESVKSLPTINFLALILTTLFLLVIGLIVVWLIVVSQAVIVNSASKINDNEKVSLKKSFIDGTPFAWKVFVLNLFAKIIVCILLSLFIGPLLTVLIAQDAKTSLLLTILAIVIFVPIAIMIGFVTKYAIAYVVLKGQKCWEALRHGWKLFTKHWLISIEMALIVLVINLALAFILLILSIIIISPFLLIGLSSGSSQMLYLLLGGSIGLIAVIFFFAAAVFATWQNTAWTLLFIKLDKGGVFPKIVRWIANKIAKKEA